MRNFSLFLSVALASLSIVSTIGCSSGSQETTSNNSVAVSNNSVAVQMLKILPSNCIGFSYMDLSELRTNEKLSGVLEYYEELGDIYYPEQASGSGIGSLVSDDLIFLFSGIANISQIYGNELMESYNYRSCTVWTQEYGSSAFIDGILVAGDDETLRACIDVVNGKADSMYDHVKNVAERLPTSFMLGIKAFPPDPIQGGAQAIQGDNYIAIEIYELNSPEAAQHYAEFESNESVISEAATRDITIDGVFVTVVTTIPPTQTAGTH